MSFKNPCVEKISCTKCGAELDAYWNNGYDYRIENKILCKSCAMEEWES